MTKALDFAGRTALVTGGARGIGLEVARLVHLRGGSVVLLDLDPEQVESAAARVGERALGVAADVTDPDRLADAVALGVERLGGLDVVIANAGIAPRLATVGGASRAAFERVLDVNLDGVVHTVRATLPHVLERRGHTVLVASVYAFLNGALAASYAMSKAAVEALAKALRAELAPYGATAGVVYFGFVDTPLVRESLTDPLAQRLQARAGRFIRPIPTSTAAAALVRGIERRARRTIVPARWWPLYLLQGVLDPLVERRLRRDPEVLAVLAEVRRREADERAGAAARTT